MLVFLEDVAIILVILFEEKREVILCSQIVALKEIPDIVKTFHDSLSVTLQALSNKTMMLLHKRNMVHRHIPKILRQHLKVKPLRIGLPILFLLLSDKGTLNLRDKLMLKDIEQVQLLKRIFQIPLHGLPISGKKRHEDVSFILNMHFKCT